jgi:hypothetical protein
LASLGDYLLGDAHRLSLKTPSSAAASPRQRGRTPLKNGAAALAGYCGAWSGIIEPNSSNSRGRAITSSNPTVKITMITRM